MVLLFPANQEPGDLDTLSPQEVSLIERMEQARMLLAEATDDFTRLRIRDEARAVEAAAAVLHLSEVQITASHLIQRAERAIAFANEPVLQMVEKRFKDGRTGFQKIPAFPAREGISKAAISNFRDAHILISDEEFEAACAASVKEGTPLTRQFFRELSQMKRNPIPKPPSIIAPLPVVEPSPAEIQERLESAEKRRQQAERELARERERSDRLEREQERWRQFQEQQATARQSNLIAEQERQRQQAAQEIERSRHLEQGTGNNERYTPDYIIQAVRQVVGDIELDPASSATANEIIQAQRYYTVELNGLAQDWTAETLWMNPPYSRGDIDAFVEKLASEVKRGAVKRALVITHNATETRWCRALLDNCAAFCLLKERVDFSTPGEQGSGTLRGQIVFLLGDKVRPVRQGGKANWDWVQRFNLAFSELGEVCIPISALKED